MVYKIEKHGVRTGNSFKRCKSISKQLHRYRQHCYLIRSHILNAGNPDPDYNEIFRFEKTGAFGEGDRLRDGIEYSLNKQRRWELPKIIEGIILGKEHGDNYDIQLIERHRLHRMANCVSVCSTGGVFHGGDISQDRKFKTKNSGGYFQSNSVLKRQPTNSRRNRRRRRRNVHENPDDNDIEATPQETNKLRYEVHYPGPMTSFLTHDAKTIGLNSNDSFRWAGFQDKRRRKTRREKLGCHIKESLSCMSDTLEDSEEESSVHEDDVGEARVCDLKVTLHEILQHANSAKQLTDSKRRHHCGSSVSSSGSTDLTDKKHLVYIEDSENRREEAVSVATKTPRAVLEPVHVILRNKDISPQEMTWKYGKQYIECDCFPRKCILNISDFVSKLNLSSFQTEADTQPLRAEACIVFIHDTDNEINSVNENVYKVFMNANFGDSLNSVKIETVFDYMETTVEEIVQRTLFFIETLPTDSIVCDKEVRVCKNLKETTIEACANWSSGSYRPSNTFLLEYYLARVPEVHEAVSMGYELVPRFDVSTNDESENVASQRDRFCCICYSVLDDNNPGTALISCSHWFCDLCWKEYLGTQTSSGSPDMLCPEFDCDKIVDPGTVLSLINMRDVICHAKRCHDTQVEQRLTTRWCPNEKCDRVLQRSRPDVKISRCTCGVEVCFECLGVPHWPASCDSAKSYQKKLRTTGDITIEPPEVKQSVVVRGKPCPKCHRFIEKNGGCPSMVCVCKAQFCWGCGQLWEGRVHGEECYKYGYKDTHNTEKRTFPASNVLEKKHRQRWYKMALQHRVNQHPGRLGKMKSYVKTMSKRIQNYLTRCENNGIPVSLDFECKTVSHKRETDKTVAYLRTTVDLYAEINQVLENTAVLLNSDELPDNSRRVLRYIAHRLSSFSDIIFELFSRSDAILASTLIERLKDVRYHSRKTIQSLIRCINSMQAENDTE